MTTTPTTVTWYYDGEPTHGVAGLACASTESEVNTVGVGPDYEFTGTAEQMAAHLLAEGYNDLDTDSPELRHAWAAQRKMARALDGVENADREEHTAWGRKETDPCERGTVGCSVLHTDYPDDLDCEVW